MLIRDEKQRGRRYDTREERLATVSSVLYALAIRSSLSFSLFSFSIRLPPSRSPLFLFLRSSFVQLPPVVFSLSFLLFLLRFDVVSWGQCLLDRILSRNTPEEEDDLPRYETSNHTRAQHALRHETKKKKKKIENTKRLLPPREGIFSGENCISEIRKV